MMIKMKTICAFFEIFLFRITKKNLLKLRDQLYDLFKITNTNNHYFIIAFDMLVINICFIY